MCWRCRGRSASIVRCSTRSGIDAVDVRTPESLDALDALILPGGESTTMSKLLDSSQLRAPVADRLRDGLPVLGTCAGLILLAAEVVDGRADQQSFGVVDVTVRRNAYGRQRDSFEADLELRGSDGTTVPGGPFHGVFIRAPGIERCGPSVEVLAVHDGRPVFVREGVAFVSTFHPELSGDLRLHQLFVDEVTS